MIFWQKAEEVTFTLKYIPFRKLFFCRMNVNICTAIPFFRMFIQRERMAATARVWVSSLNKLMAHQFQLSNASLSLSLKS